MANVHRIGDYQGNPGGGPGAGGGNYYGGAQRGGGGGMANPNIGIPMMGMGGLQGGKPPRDETCWDMLKFACCPNFKWHSFIAIMTILDVMVYIFTLALGGLELGGQLLTPQCWVLLDMGNKYPYAMKYQYEIWRFVTPVFLHAYFLHILMNMCSQLIIGNMMERMVGEKLVILIYFLSAVAGNLFSSVVEPNSFSVGASTAIAGMLGLLIAWVIINWESLPSMFKCLMSCMIFMIIFWNLSLSMNSFGGGSSSEESENVAAQPSQVDNWGHLGGILCGVFAGLARIKPMARHGNYEKNCSLVGSVVCSGGFLALFLVFYLSTHTPQMFC
jgi:membrane associated rhomboid family serine protease